MKTENKSMVSRGFWGGRERWIGGTQCSIMILYDTVMVKACHLHTSKPECTAPRVTIM